MEGSQEEKEDAAAVPAGSLRGCSEHVSRAAVLHVSCYASEELEILGRSTVHKCSMSSFFEQLPIFVNVINRGHPAFLWREVAWPKITIAN